MTIRFVTDSTCDLPPEIVAQYHITVIPLVISVGSQEFRDGVDISRQQFYERLPGMRPSPQTAAPGPEVFRRAYDQLAGEGAEQILSIHISRALSAVIDSARHAAAETTAASVTAFDSRQLSLGTGFEVLTAAQAGAQGRSLPEILDLLQGQIARTHVFAALDTLEYMRRGGRMNAAISALGSLLQVKPVLKMYEGNPTAERVRTRQGAMKRLRELLTEHAPFEKVAVLHSGAAARAQEVLRGVEDLLPAGEIWAAELNPVLGAHVGPGVVGFACISLQ